MILKVVYIDPSRPPVKVGPPMIANLGDKRLFAPIIHNEKVAAFIEFDLDGERISYCVADEISGQKIYQEVENRTDGFHLFLELAVKASMELGQELGIFAGVRRPA